RVDVRPSRRRHTTVARDWSSDVCSSDLPPFQATASVTFVSDVEGLEVLGEQLLESVETQLEDSRLAAIEANEEFLARPGFSITADPGLGRLTFVATGSSAAEAEANVDEMRRRLVELDPFDIEGELTRQIESKLAK